MIKVFDYIPELDAFKCTDAFREITELLSLAEWTHCVWIGRFFLLDNDFGEHWHDNWEEREKIDDRAKELGYNSDELLIINPERFSNGLDGPCHDASQRKRFWTDVMKSLHLSLETIFEEARLNVQDPDLEQKIQQILDLQRKIKQ